MRDHEQRRGGSQCERAQRVGAPCGWPAPARPGAAARQTIGSRQSDRSSSDRRLRRARTRTIHLHVKSSRNGGQQPVRHVAYSWGSDRGSAAGPPASRKRPACRRQKMDATIVQRQCSLGVALRRLGYLFVDMHQQRRSDVGQPCTTAARRLRIGVVGRMDPRFLWRCFAPPWQ